MSVVIETTIGDITVDLFVKQRPITSLNFLKLCRMKAYNFNLFHTIEKDFIAQTGDPSGTGQEGSSIWGLLEGAHKRFFEQETVPRIQHKSAGLLSLVGTGKKLISSQFFFTLSDNLSSLDGDHCVIGAVVEGRDTLRKLNEAIVDENGRPYQDIRITHTVILNDPFKNPLGFRTPQRSPSPTAERLQSGRIPADEVIDNTDGKSMAELQEIMAAREANARATILEIVGDLPDAEMAPPENVLFVCKLNPITTQDDLEIIFSRFGAVKCCEVIKDQKSGESLQYAFVEFEDQKACEAAYFKIDNVLIDDRRIHVDFSQSVAKMKWRGKGRGVAAIHGRLNHDEHKGDLKSSKTRRIAVRPERRVVEKSSKDYGSHSHRSQNREKDVAEHASRHRSQHHWSTSRHESRRRADDRRSRSRDRQRRHQREHKSKQQKHRRGTHNI